METLRGIASNVNSTSIEYPGRSKYAKKRTVHISYFQINGRQIKFESTRPQGLFYEGNQMIVAGVTQSGILNALAYKDLTTGNEGSQGWLLWFFVGVIFLGVGIAIISIIDGRATVGQIIGVGIFGGVFLAFSAGLLFLGTRTLQAINALRKEVP
jgi:hypothetical protein